MEHALCPLDSNSSLRNNLVFQSEYVFADQAGRLRKANVELSCAAGLSAGDEFYLWGLLGLTFSQPELEAELHATPHYCLRRLGLIDQHGRRGGRQYQRFAEVIDRLSLVSYRNSGFYDPIRGEHRRVGFGFLSYSLPVDPDSCRAWRIAWDPVFFDLIRPVGGHLGFDLELYRELDPATRRLFMLLSKIFRRRTTTPKFELRHLAVNVLGFADSVSTGDLKVKVKRCVERLVEREVVVPVKDQAVFERKRQTQYSVALCRGSYFDKSPGLVLSKRHSESAMAELLRQVGFDDRSIRRLVSQYPSRLLREWADITLAAMEQFGMEFFRKSAPAYFVDNVRNAAQGRRTPPDWWHDLRKAENLARSPSNRGRGIRRLFEPVTARDNDPGDLEQITSEMCVHFQAAGQPGLSARKNAERFAREYLDRRGRPQTDPKTRGSQVET